MKYNKPEIVLLASAVNSVRKTQKDNTTYADGVHPLFSPNAYEADE